MLGRHPVQAGLIGIYTPELDLGNLEECLVRPVTLPDYKTDIPEILVGKLGVYLKFETRGHEIPVFRRQRGGIGLTRRQLDLRIQDLYPIVLPFIRSAYFRPLRP